MQIVKRETVLTTFELMHNGATYKCGTIAALTVTGDNNTVLLLQGRIESLSSEIIQVKVFPVFKDVEATEIPLVSVIDIAPCYTKLAQYEILSNSEKRTLSIDMQIVIPAEKKKLSKKDMFSKVDNALMNRFFLLDVETDIVLEVLNSINPEMIIGNAVEMPRALLFESTEAPAMIFAITDKLQKTGFSDTPDKPHTYCAKSGKNYDKYYAYWTFGAPVYLDVDHWNISVTIEDMETGISFTTGTSNGSTSDMVYYMDIIKEHRKA